MAKYSIEDTTLTALGDAVRGKAGETKKELADTVLIDEEIARNEEIKYYLPKGTDNVRIKALAGTTGSTTICSSSGVVFHHVNFPASGVWSYNYMQDGFYFKHVSSEDGVNRRAFEITCYDASGNIIQGGQPIKNTMTPLQMAETIEGLPPAPPESAFNIKDNCAYRFAQGGWDWFIEQHGDKITTNNITNANYMFYNSNLTSIPFDINVRANAATNVASLFDGCIKLTNIPKITGRIDTFNYAFNACNRLRELKEESVAEIDWSYIDNLTSGYNGNRSSTFPNCYSLRKFPMSFLAHGNPVVTYSYAIYYSLFTSCYALDEVVDLPVIHRKAKLTSNIFNATFNACHRLKRITFETNEDGSPIKIDGWSKQAIDLSKNVGFSNTSTTTVFTGYNSGITEDKYIKDDATYAALKNDEDSFAVLAKYSRYNKTSAVETINTLPDLSGGAGGNTIKFTGAAGSATDGGAINTMTQEEIAVATAKGWTVSFA